MAKFNILIADDDSNTLDMLTDFLGQFDFSIETASNGEQALEFLRKKNFDVVISDQKMPGLKGVELLEKVKSAAPDSIRILMSGYSNFEDAISSINKGEIFRFLQKPVDLKELETCIFQGIEIYEAKTLQDKRYKLLEEKVQKLIKIASALSIEHDIQNLLSMIVKEARKLTNSDAGSIYRIIDNNLVFEIAQNETLSKRMGKELPFKRIQLPLTKESIAGYVACTGEIINITDVYDLDDSIPYDFNPAFDKQNDYKTKSVLAVPILNYQEEIIGVVQLINAIDENNNVIAFSNKDVDLILSLSSQAGVAIQTALFINEIKSLDRMKTRFMTVSGHELRTPVAIINEYTKILIDGVAGELNPEQIDILKTASNNIEHLKGLVEDILTMIKLDFKKDQLVLDEVTLSEVIKDSVKDFMYFIKERRLTLRILKSSDVIMECDKKKLKQLFSNLLSNAIKFTPDGGEIKFLIYQNPTHVKIVVEDNGIGIPDNQLKKIFDKFYQLGDETIHSTSKTKFMGGGPGLGLSICKGIVEEHSGKIWAESEGENKGSRFNIILPLIQNKLK